MSKNRCVKEKKDHKMNTNAANGGNNREAARYDMHGYKRKGNNNEIERLLKRVRFIDKDIGVVCKNGLNCLSFPE